MKLNMIRVGMKVKWIEDGRECRGTVAHLGGRAQHGEKVHVALLEDGCQVTVRPGLLTDLGSEV